MYVESDGRVFLVDRAGRLDLPEAHEVPFDVDIIAPLPGDVCFCVPRLDRHPQEWHAKDELPTLPNASPHVRAAVHATMPRVIVEGLCVREKKILLVKGNRGLTEGRWTLPGGFLRFGETPEQGVLREIREETGLDGTIEGLSSAHSKLGRQTRLHWVMLFYRVTVKGEPQPNPDEIAEARFFPPGEATKVIFDDAMAGEIRALMHTSA
ncbi:MAG: NUDIX hydrolase [Candidatus Bipolaricaulia bacterium]